MTNQGETDVSLECVCCYSRATQRTTLTNYTTITTARLGSPIVELTLTYITYTLQPFCNGTVSLDTTVC